MFEGLVKNLNTQKAEADELRQKASSAVEAAMQAEDEVASRLRSCLADERAQSALERQNLLSQITELVHSTGKVADTRWESKISAACNELSTTTSSLQVANISFNGGMDIWSRKEQSLVEDVLKSRETLKAKMKQDWTVG
jgi:kinesin family protein 11